MKQAINSKTTFNLQQLLEDCVQRFGKNELYKEANLHIIDDLVSPLCVIADRSGVEQVMERILKNAVVNFRATKIMISLKQLLKTDKDILLEFTVEDNGKLVAATDAHSKEMKNIHLLIADAGGMAEVSYIEGIGNTIKFMFKFLWEPCSSDQLLESSSNKLRGRRILVAEDNEINQKIIAHLLRREKILVDVANNGKEAVELFEKNNYDLLLLDLQMPHMDGFETANYIRRKVKSSIPIIAMTASSFSNEQTRCFEVGINQYLNKPFVAEDLFQRLRYFLLNEHQLTYQRPLQISARDLYSLHLIKQTNEADQVIEILEMFIYKTPELLDDIKAEIKAQNLLTVVEKIAKLKGSLGSLQMHSMMQIVSDIEMLLRMEDYIKISTVINHLYKEYRLVGPLLKQELEALKSKTSVE
jgi:CheY-like chemotaxis protein/HPt (histidine-containing phosphotransfer) domain-containing protein